MIAMEALDSLLVSCHAQSLNLFVESFLRMVQKLLECDEPDLQCLATTSVSRLQLGCCFKYSHDSLPKKGEIPLRKIEIEHINLLINLKGNFFEPAVGSCPNFNRMCG